jgi:hypothetical protein
VHGFYVSCLSVLVPTGSARPLLILFLVTGSVLQFIHHPFLQKLSSIISSCGTQSALHCAGMGESLFSVSLWLVL